VAPSPPRGLRTVLPKYKKIALARKMTIAKLVTRIDRTREPGNLSSAIRLFVLHHVRDIKVSNRTRRRSLTSTMTLASLLKIAEQVVAIAGLAQEGNRSGLHGTYPHVFIRMACEENNGDAIAHSDQPVL
jgi:hypothetical protein